MYEPNPHRNSQLHEALGQRCSQSMVATFDDLRRWAAVEIATYRSRLDGSGFQDELTRQSERLSADRHHQKRATARALKHLLKPASQDNGSQRLLRKPQFAAAAPIGGTARVYSALWTSDVADSYTEQESVARDQQLAALAREAWRKYHPRSLQHPIELFVHPASLLARYATKVDIRSEPGITFAHLSDLMSRLCVSSDAEARGAGETFQVVARPFCWEDDMSAATAAERYAPEAVYEFRGGRVELYFPMAFHWRPVDDIVEFVRRLRRRLSGQKYRICCPGFAGDCERQPAEFTHINLDPTRLAFLVESGKEEIR